jgi:Arc/MetJ family transcription regulator
MRRTSIELDEDQLTQVQRVLGTTGVKDTIDHAFAEILRADRRRRLARRVRLGEGVDRGEEILGASRRWKR